MKKGDLAFFYHSNTKEPGIVGTMEIVEEHSPDCMSPPPPPLNGGCLLTDTHTSVRP